MNRKRIAVIAAAVALIFAVPVVATAQDSVPTGEEILQKYIEATGGQETYDSINNRMMKAKIQLVNAGLTLDVQTWIAKPNKVYSIVEAEAVGKIFRGSTGEVAWSMSDMQGPVIEQGAPLEAQLRDSTFDRLVYWDSVYDSVKSTGIEEIDGKSCFKVEFEPKPWMVEHTEAMDPAPATVYFDKQSYFPVRIQATILSSSGEIPVTVTFDDYQEVGGIMIARKATMDLAGQSRLMTIQLVEQNLDLPDDRFDPPAEIQKLLKQAADK